MMPTCSSQNDVAGITESVWAQAKAGDVQEALKNARLFRLEKGLEFIAITQAEPLRSA